MIDENQYDNANECFKDADFEYLPNLFATQNCDLKRFKYLQTKFKNVAVVKINNEIERYRIGSMDENAILGEDYILIQKNLKYNRWLGQTWFTPDNIPHVCIYSLAEKGKRKAIIKNFRFFDGCIYVKLCRTFNGMVLWITLKFKQFKK